MSSASNRSHLEHRFECSLRDLAPRMLEVSHSINPGASCRR